MQKKIIHFQMGLSQVEVREDNTLSIEGYASTPDIDRYNSIIEVDGLSNGLNNYLKNPIILLGHNDTKPIGNMSDYKLDNSGLWIRALLNKDTDGIFDDIKAGRTKGFSIGFVPLSWYYKDRVSGKNLKDMTEEEYNNVNYNDIVRVINKVDLVEISVVNIPANPNALFTISKSVRAFFDDIETRNAIDYERRMLIKNEHNPFIDSNVEVDIPGEEKAPASDTNVTPPANDVPDTTNIDTVPPADEVIATTADTPNNDKTDTTDINTDSDGVAKDDIVTHDPDKIDAENADNTALKETPQNGTGAETPPVVETVQPSQEVQQLSAKLADANKTIDDLLGYCKDLIDQKEDLQAKLNITPVNRPVINSRISEVSKPDPLTTVLKNAKAQAMEL